MTRQLVDEWIGKAEEDWSACQQLLATQPSAVPDVIGYLAQQSAEKYLKACLVQLGREPERTHDLGALLDRVVESNPQLEHLRDDAEALTPLAVRFRYPGSSLTLEQARQGVTQAEHIRAAATALLAGQSGRDPEAE